MELIETNKIIYLNTHFAYWVQDNKVFRGKIKINKRRNPKKLRLIKNTTKELKEISTPDATLQKILKSHGVKIIHEIKTNTKEEPIKKIIHQKISGQRKCKCGADSIHLLGHGYFCVTKLNERLKEWNYKIIKTGE